MIRYPTLPSRSSYRTFTLVHYIRRDAPPSFTTSAYPGQFHLVGFSCAWARAYTSNSPYFWGTRCLPPRRLPPFISKKICVDSTTATALADSTRLLLNNPHPEQTNPRQTSSNLQAPRPPAPFGLDSPLDIVWLLFWLHRQHDAASIV